MTEKSLQAEGSAVSVPAETIERSILLVRGHKVMLDRDLAQLYSVETRTLNQAVRRNIRRFPPDFMFHMTQQEFAEWRSQIVMSKTEKMGLRRRPLVFTEQGVAMLSSVLGSDRAIDVNIAIMRAFVRLRELMATHKELARKIEELEQKYDAQFSEVFHAIRKLMEPAPVPPKRRIGFSISEE
ncbi:MAG TPA: ORF6N domain-containing protein [Terriglobia bacterium]|nr:ORF6N domain-containing protein [Terriglobia bacterium]